MGIPITPEDPIDGGVPTCAAFVTDDLHVIYFINGTGTWDTVATRFAPGVNVWFSLFTPGPFPLDIRIDFTGPNDSLRFRTDPVTFDVDFDGDNCDFPMGKDLPIGSRLDIEVAA